MNVSMQKRCLILGGGGFIGTAVTEQLLCDGWNIRIFERPNVLPLRNFFSKEQVEWITGDYLSEIDVLDALMDMDAVVHLISTTLPKSSNEDPVQDVQSNIVPTLKLLDAMVKMRIQRIVFASSGGTVYGAPQSIPIKEEHPTDPYVSYGISKLMIEKYLFLYSRLYGIKPVVLRISNPYGNGQRMDTAQGVIAAFLHRAVAGMPVEIWGDGSVVRDYLHVTDVAVAFARALRYTGSRQIFNIGSGLGISLNDLLESIEAVTERKIERRYLPSRSFDVSVNILDNTLARQELCWSPRVSLIDGLKLTLPFTNC